MPFFLIFTFRCFWPGEGGIKDFSVGVPVWVCVLLGLCVCVCVLSWFYFLVCCRLPLNGFVKVFCFLRGRGGGGA